MLHDNDIPDRRIYVYYFTLILAVRVFISVTTVSALKI